MDVAGSRVIILQYVIEESGKLDVFAPVSGQEPFILGLDQEYLIAPGREEAIDGMPDNAESEPARRGYDLIDTFRREVTKRRQG